MKKSGKKTNAIYNTSGMEMTTRYMLTTYQHRDGLLD